MKDNEHFYKKLEKLIPKIEGEIIQDMYFFFKTFDLKEEQSQVKYKEELIPTIDNIEEMIKGLKKIFKDRHDIFIKEDLYREDWL